ncbi:MAG: hypothetical protein JRN68_10655 [Nitrososphaerota archaeon]|jgi:DNA-binding HxlR family transcriptional regulator|nr:hypothetical protein [Nitrososphaerota archaeon]
MTQLGEGKKKLERAIGTVGRLRILAVLADPNRTPMSKYQLEKMTGLRSASLASDLNALMEVGWVVEVGKSERRHLYTLSENDDILNRLIGFLESAGYVKRNQ